MAILYNHFVSMRTVFYVLFAAFCLFTAFEAFAASPLFTVRDIKVDVTSENSIKAREHAFAKAQQDAFAVLAERMTDEGAGQDTPMPDVATISSLIQDFEVTEEKLSSVRYIGTYTFRFKDKEVRNYFSGHGVRFTDVSSRPVLVLPFYQRGNRMVIWSPYNDWMRAWNRAGDMQGLVPLVVPIGDLMDVSDINDDEALTYDEEKLERMLARYDAGEAVLAIAIPDDHLSLVKADQDQATGALAVQIYRTDRAGPEAVRGFTVSAKGGESKAELFDRAAREVHKSLQKNWKDKTIVGPEGGNTLQVRVHFSGLDEWARTQRALERVYGVNEIILKSLSSNEARVDLIFQGTERRLRLALAQADMTLTEPRINPTSFGQSGGALPLVYELYLNSLRPGSGF